jgi:hypothetical protein
VADLDSLFLNGFLGWINGWINFTRELNCGGAKFVWLSRFIECFFVLFYIAVDFFIPFFCSLDRKRTPAFSKACRRALSATLKATVVRL